MLVKLVWPDGRIEEIEHASVNASTTVLEMPQRGSLPPGHYDPSKMTLHVHGRPGDPDVVTSVANYGALVHRFRRIHVGNVDTGDIHALWVHADTDVHIVKRVVDAVAEEKRTSSMSSRKLSIERIAGYRKADPANLDAGITRDDLIGHIEALETPFAAALDEHARYVEQFMSEPGGLVSGPDLVSRRQTPEERPYSPASEQLRRLDPRAWYMAAMDLFRATRGHLSLAFMPANETEWQVGDAWARYHLMGKRCPHRVGGDMPENRWRCFDCGELLARRPIA